MRRHAARVPVLTLALAAVLAGCARPAAAELPALTREVVSEDFRTSPQALKDLAARRHVALGVGLGEFLRGRGGGTWDPANQTGSLWGARAEALVRFGRLMLGGEAVNDGRLDADPDTYAQRLMVGVHVPEAFVALTGSVGLERWKHAGDDLSAEFAPILLPLGMASADEVPALRLWARLRHPERGEDVLTPVVGLFQRHLPVVGSRLPLLVSLRGDLADHALPVTSGMVQIGYASVPVPLSGATPGDPDLPPPGARAPSLVDRSFFVAVGYAFPLDPRSTARLAVQAGLRFTRPLGGE